MAFNIYILSVMIAEEEDRLHAWHNAKDCIANNSKDD